MTTEKADPETVLRNLVSAARPFGEIDVFSCLPGIYAVFFFGSEFPLASAKRAIKRGTLVYIGKTESRQIERDQNQHFASGQTGRSTLRRSIGAILRASLYLKPEPRNQNESSDRTFRNYRFDAVGEQRLTEWMKANLGLSFFEYDRVPAEIDERETQLIRLATPILNLKDNPANRWMVEIKELRSVCVQLARSPLGSTSPRATSVAPQTKRSTGTMSGKMTLHKAMEAVLLDCPNHTATFAYVADQITTRGLYAQKEGDSAPASQIRLRASK